MKCPNCDEDQMEETTLKGGQLHYTCGTCGYAETR